MNEQAVKDVSEVLSTTSLPIEPEKIEASAKKLISYYAGASKKITLPENEVAERFSELWSLWLEGDSEPSAELKSAVKEAIAVDENLNELASGYFTLEKKLEDKNYMNRGYAIALIGSANLIRTLVVEQHLGLERIREIVNVPKANFGEIKSVLSCMGVAPSFDPSVDVEIVHKSDVDDVAALFGDALPEESEETLRGLLGAYSRGQELYSNVTELVYIGFEPYLFFLYYELLTLEKTDRFPGQAIYEHSPRNQSTKMLWNSMYKPDQENPYLNNAKSVYSLDAAWAGTKISKETRNGSLLLADIFEILAEFPYSTRRSVSRIIRCYLVLMSSKTQISTPIPDATPNEIKAYVREVSRANSLTKGVLDQRLVDFLTMCLHDDKIWVARGLGASVNESNKSARKYGDVEYTNVEERVIQAYEAHGGGLRDEYVEDHIRSLHGTVRYYKNDAKEHGSEYDWTVKVIYIAHDISRLSKFQSGYQTVIEGIDFELEFLTFKALVKQAGGLESVGEQTDQFKRAVHSRISRLPDNYTLKQRYIEIVEQTKA